MTFLPKRSSAIHSPIFYAFLILLLAVLLRLWGLGEPPLWLDEAMEFWVASSNLKHILASVRTGIQDPPLYSILLHFWMQFGQSEAWLRLLSLGFSLFSVLGVMVLGWQLAGSRGATRTALLAGRTGLLAGRTGLLAGRTGLLAGLIMAVLPTQVRYAQEIGQYALMTCGLVWSLVLFQAALRRPGWRWQVAWLGAALLASYSYYGALITILAPAGYELIKAIHCRQWAVFKRLLASVTLLLAGLLPLGLFFLPAQLLRGPTSKAFQAGALSPAALFTTLTTDTTQMLAFQLTGAPYTNIPAWLPALLALTLLGLAAANHQVRHRGAFFNWFALTWLISALASQMGLYPFGFRYSLILTPFLAPLLATGLDRLFQSDNGQGLNLRWMGMALCALLLGLALFSLPVPAIRSRIDPQAAWPWPETHYSLRPAVEYWRDHRTGQAPTYVYYRSSPTFRYYLHLYQLDTVSPPGDWYIDCWLNKPTPACRSQGVIYGEWFQQRSPAEQYASIQVALPPETGAFWIVFTSVYANERELMMEQISQAYQIEQQFEDQGVWLYQVQQRGLAAPSE